jgi:hypothetical protein
LFQRSRTCLPMRPVPNLTAISDHCTGGVDSTVWMRQGPERRTGRVSVDGRYLGHAPMQALHDRRVLLRRPRPRRAFRCPRRLPRRDVQRRPAVAAHGAAAAPAHLRRHAVPIDGVVPCRPRRRRRAAVAQHLVLGG